jgi:hypothetical protein
MPEARCLDLENPQKRTPGDAVQKKRGKEKNKKEEARKDRRRLDVDA